MVAVLRFLRGATMMEFGIPAAQRGVAGTPPPVLRFNYLGAHMYNNIPVVVTDFSFNMQRDLDYVEVQMPDGGNRGLAGIFNDALFGEAVVTTGNRTYVPTRLELTVSLQIQENTRNVRENFDLNAFKRGDLINKGFI